jgi:hypothetical protein
VDKNSHPLWRKQKKKKIKLLQIYPWIKTPNTSSTHTLQDFLKLEGWEKIATKEIRETL